MFRADSYPIHLIHRYAHHINNQTKVIRHLKAFKKTNIDKHSGAAISAGQSAFKMNGHLNTDTQNITQYSTLLRYQN